MKSKLAIAVCLMQIMFFSACRKQAVNQTKLSELELDFTFMVDGRNLDFDTLIFVNDAGNIFSVSKLEFILSNFELTSGNGSHAFGNVEYVNAGIAGKTKLRLTGIPLGEYSGLKCLIGLDSLRNISNGLPGTLEFNSMFWPVQMGGGYHFMKLEGKFVDSGAHVGYAIHLGKNGNAVSCIMPFTFTVDESSKRVSVEMDLSEWFKNPYRYDLKKDGRYTMSTDSLMALISHNGRDVLKIKSVK